MRRSLALLTMVLLSLTAIACGASSATTHSTPPRPQGAATSAHSSTLSGGGYSKNDGDRDYDDDAHYRGSPPNDDRSLLVGYGPRASPAEVRAVTSVVKRYYVASLAGNGAAACSLLTASLAGGLAAGYSQPNHGSTHTCAAVLSPLLAQQHQRLLDEDVSTMGVTAVHVKGTLGLAVLGFKTAPEGEIPLEREGHSWKVAALFGGDMT
jgi:hypothetical protein